MGYIVCMSQLIEAIKQAVAASGKSRYRIYQESGVLQSQLSRLMSGERGLKVEAIERLADALGLEIIVRPKRGRAKGQKQRHKKGE